MNKGMKFRIYPNKEQQNLINRTFGCARLVYNQGLAYRIEHYKAGKKANYTVTNAMLTEMKQQEEYAFLKEVDSIALQQALRDLDRAYQNFFKHLGKYPRFKSKHNHRQSYRIAADAFGSHQGRSNYRMCNLIWCRLPRPG